MAFEGGPYVQAGCFCETVIEDKIGSLSLIRIIDTITHTQASPEPPETLPPFNYGLRLVLMLKSGSARGRSNLRIVPELPTGASLDAVTVTVHFEGEEKGANVVSNLAMRFENEGLYWFKVMIDDEILTQIPLRVRYNRIVTGPSIKQAS